MSSFYSLTLDHTRCHIRNYHDQIIPRERVDQRPHKHYSMEFHCILSGEETVILPTQGRQLRLVPGQILMIPTEVYHGVQTGAGTVERLCFSFSVEEPEKTGGALADLFRSCREALLFENKNAMLLVEQYRRLRQQDHTPLSNDQQGVLLLSTVLELLRQLPAERKHTGKEASRTDRQKWIMEEYIERHLTDNSGLEGLAKELFLSQRQTRTLVRRFFGEDYKQLIIRRRMELADIFLQDRSKSLDEIAQLVGYRSYSGFQLCFKRYFGVTPQDKRCIGSGVDLPDPALAQP